MIFEQCITVSILRSGIFSARHLLDKERKKNKIMKKRMMTIVMTGILAASLTACGGTASSSSAGSSSAASSSSSDEDAYTISFIVKHTDGHFTKVMTGAQAYADEHPGVNVEFISPASATNYDEQANMIETALTTDSVDALVICPLQSETAANLVSGTEKVIISCDTDFDAAEKSAFVGTGNKDAAYNAAAAMMDAAAENGVDQPTVVVLTGAQGDETHEARLAGFTEGSEAGNGEVIEVQYCDAAADKAVTAMESIIQKYPEGVDCVMATSDDMALAAAKVVKDSGGDAFADTLICGFDGNTSALEAIQDGSLSMSASQEGYDMGYKAVEAAVAVLNGETVESFIDSGSTVVKSDNVEEYIEKMKDMGVWDL